jgi:hypothetical protein
MAAKAGFVITFMLPKLWFINAASDDLDSPLEGAASRYRDRFPGGCLDFIINVITSKPRLGVLVLMAIVAIHHIRNPWKRRSR